MPVTRLSPAIDRLSEVLENMDGAVEVRTMPLLRDIAWTHGYLSAVETLEDWAMSPEDPDAV